MNPKAVRVVEDTDLGVVVLGSDRTPIAIFPERFPEEAGGDDWLTGDVVIEVSGLRSFAVCLELVTVLLENEYPSTLTVVSRHNEAVRFALSEFTEPEVTARLISEGQLAFVEK